MKVAIVCGSPSSEFLAPYHDKTWEIWVLGNRLERHIDKRVTRVFEVHDNLSEHSSPEEYAQWLVSKKLPLIVGEKFPVDSPLCTTFPYQKSEELFGSLYLTSSPAYMICYALLLGAKEIALYGVDLSIGDHEYFWQRACVEAWIGFAKCAIGWRNFFIPAVSHVGKSSYVEGRDWNGDTEVELFSEDDFNSQAAECSKQKEALQSQRQDLALKAAALDGAEQVFKHLAKVSRAVDAKIDVKSLSEATRLR